MPETLHPVLEPQLQNNAATKETICNKACPPTPAK